MNTPSNIHFRRCHSWACEKSGKSRLLLAVAAKNDNCHIDDWF